MDTELYIIGKDVAELKISNAPLRNKKNAEIGKSIFAK